MANEILNHQGQAAVAMQTNSNTDHPTAPGAAVGSALRSISMIPTGTVLCNKYTVTRELDVMGAKAALFVCEADDSRYVVKLHRRDAAIKDDVASALKKIDSPYVAKLCDIGIYHGFPFEIVPYYEQGSLQGRTFSFEELKSKIIPGLIEGLRILHKNRIIHKNLKPSNIMLCDNEEDVVLTDFGISSIHDGTNTILVAQAGMVSEYSAPETFRNLFLKESDYYSLGITLFELYTGRTPYSTLRSEEEIVQCMSARRIPFPVNMPTELCDLITGLTYHDISSRKNKADPNRRWTYDEVMKWYIGEPQQIPGTEVASSADQIPAYAFLKRRYTTLSTLAEALAVNWEQGKQQLYRGLLSGFFKNFDPEIAGYCMDAEDAQRKGGDPDIVFFQTIYRISPNTRAFYWRGSRFNSLTDFGSSILAHLRSCDRSSCGVYEELLSMHVITEYAAIRDAGNEQLISSVRKLEDHFISHRSNEREKRLAYYLAGYMLSGQRTLVIGSLSVVTVDELVKQLQALLAVSADKFQSICDQLIDSFGRLDEQLEAWLLILGKHQELIKWRHNEYGTQKK